MLVEEKRLAEADDEIQPIARREVGGVDVAQRVARLRQIGWIGRLAEALEPRPSEHDAGGRTHVGERLRLGRGGHRLVELPVVVERPRARQGVDARRRFRRRRRGAAPGGGVPGLRGSRPGDGRRQRLGRDHRQHQSNKSFVRRSFHN